MASSTVRTLVRNAGTDHTPWHQARNIIAIGRNYAYHAPLIPNFPNDIPPNCNSLTLQLDWTLTGLAVCRDHIAELGNKRPDKPIFFLKPHSSLVTPPSPEHTEWAPLLIPKGVDVHYEIELAVQIRQYNHNLGYWKRKSRDEQEWEQVWKDCIGGYGVAIDFTARNVQEEAKAKGLPWTAAKGYSRFLPISQFIAKLDIPDPHNVRLNLQRNGETVQNDNTNLMLFKIPELLVAITDVMDLHAGDIVLTGTPKGVGRVTAGDELKASAFVGEKEVTSFRIRAEDRTDKDGNSY